MELKLAKVGGIEYAVYTFNRTAYGIEMKKNYRKKMRWYYF